MDDLEILRSNSTRIFMSSYFIFIDLVFLTALSKNGVAPFPVAIVLFCLYGIFRSVRCGYVAVGDEKVIVRTLIRSRTFKTKDIMSVEPRFYIQFTSRVRPVLLLKDGGTYPLSEFFMQKRLYEGAPDQNKISTLITAIAGKLN